MPCGNYNSPDIDDDVCVRGECEYPVDATSMLIWHEVESESPPWELKSLPVVVDIDEMVRMWIWGNRKVIESGSFGKLGIMRGERMCLRIMDDDDGKVKMSYEKWKDLVRKMKVESLRVEHKNAEDWAQKNSKIAALCGKIESHVQ